MLTVMRKHKQHSVCSKSVFIFLHTQKHLELGCSLYVLCWYFYHKGEGGGQRKMIWLAGVKGPEELRAQRAGVQMRDIFVR